jgi:hypothetical protein
MLNILFKEIFTPPETKRYRDEINGLKDEIKRLNEDLNKLGTIKGIINKITENKIEWFDYFKLTPEQQRIYHTKAQEALSNEAIMNEMNKITNECANWCLTQSNDFKGIEAMRYQISGMRLLMERIGEIPNPNIKKEEVEEPYSPI